MLHVGVHVPIGKQAYEMDGSALSGSLNNTAPEVCPKNLTRLKGLVDQTGPLFKNPSCSQGIVSHFAIAHVMVGW